MRTTVRIDDDVLRAARQLANSRGQSLGEALSELARASLTRAAVGEYRNFDAAPHLALRLKAAETDRSVSDLVNETVRASLAEDASDLIAIEECRDEPELSFEAVV